MTKPTRLDYCQYLLSTPINYTLTHFADPCKAFSTNDLNQSEASIAETVCAWRWKIEQFHCEAKQLTGLEKCQCRLSRIVRNHIACAFLVWIRLMREAHETAQTLYQVKHGMLSEYLREQLKSPTLKMDAA